MRYARNPEVLWRSTSRGPVLLPPHDDRPERLGGVAAVVWEVLDTPMFASDVAESVHLLLGEIHDVSAALEALQHADLVIAES